MMTLGGLNGYSFGKINEREFKFGIILSYIYPKTNIWYILLILFVLGILLHRLFCVKTTLDRFLFGN